MTDEIKPALSTEEWNHVLHPSNLPDGKHIVRRGAVEYRLFAGQVETWNAASGGWDILTAKEALIALANAALPDSDPRKITREMVNDLRSFADQASSEFGVDLESIADALESYLPPALAKDAR